LTDTEYQVDHKTRSSPSWSTGHETDMARSRGTYSWQEQMASRCCPICVFDAGCEL